MCDEAPHLTLLNTVGQVVVHARSRRTRGLNGRWPWTQRVAWLSIYLVAYYLLSRRSAAPLVHGLQATFSHFMRVNACLHFLLLCWARSLSCCCHSWVGGMNEGGRMGVGVREVAA